MRQHDPGEFTMWPSKVPLFAVRSIRLSPVMIIDLISPAPCRVIFSILVSLSFSLVQILPKYSVLKNPQSKFFPYWDMRDMIWLFFFRHVGGSGRSSIMARGVIFFATNVFVLSYRLSLNSVCSEFCLIDFSTPQFLTSHTSCVQFLSIPEYFLCLASDVQYKPWY